MRRTHPEDMNIEGPIFYRVKFSNGSHYECQIGDVEMFYRFAKFEGDKLSFTVTGHAEVAGGTGSVLLFTLTGEQFASRMKWDHQVPPFVQ